MMKKLSITVCVITLAVALSGAETSVFAQFRAQKPRGRPGKLNPRFGPREGRLPNERNVDPQFDRAGQRRPGLGPEQKRRLQQQLMQAIGLTEDQRTRMADIRRSHEDALISAGRRLRQARQALDRTIMNEQYDEALIRQRTEELSQAQADMLRLQTRMRSQVRSVLTSEQVVRFNELERRLRRQMREQKLKENQTREDNQNSSEQNKPPDLEELDLVSLLLFKD
jgi:Spy/CpxP family protein refolding chaperone